MKMDRAILVTLITVSEGHFRTEGNLLALFCVVPITWRFNAGGTSRTAVLPDSPPPRVYTAPPTRRSVSRYLNSPSFGTPLARAKRKASRAMRRQAA